jgi:hypothetical protein
VVVELVTQRLESPREVYAFRSALVGVNHRKATCVSSHKSQRHERDSLLLDSSHVPRYLSKVLAA